MEIWRFGEVQGNEKVKGSGLKNKLGKNGKTKEKKVKKEEISSTIQAFQ